MIREAGRDHVRKLTARDKMGTYKATSKLEEKIHLFWTFTENDEGIFPRRALEMA